MAYRRGSPVRLAGAIVLLGLALGCASARPPGTGAPILPRAALSDDVVQITLLQMNDVYEVTPTGGGDEGGLARVATVRQELLRRNPNTFTVLAGDLFSPSAIDTAKVDGQRLAGRQMVDVMNVLGLDYATFGNHEVDLTKSEFLARLSESKTQWFSSNTTDANGQGLPHVPSDVVFTVKNRAGRTARVGLFGVTLVGASGYVSYADPLTKAREEVAALRPKVDVLIAVTHQAIVDDVAMVEKVPGIDLVIGGHEHENYQAWRGAGLTPITKADANVRTVYIHDILVDTVTHKVDVQPRLRHVDRRTPEDPAVAARAQGWVDKAFAAFRAQGFEPGRIVTTITEPLDGSEATVRNHPNRLCDIITQGMLRAVPGAEWAVFNSGSIRIDDVIAPGPMTEYDVLRTLPFGGTVQSVEMKGALLQKMLDQGVKNAGSGGFLQSARASTGPIDPNRTYLVAITDFLLTGAEKGLDYLKPDNPDLRVRKGTTPDVEVQQSFIAELKREYPGK